VTASALIEQDIEETLIFYRTKLQMLESVEEEVLALEGELEELRDRYPRQYREVSERLEIDLDTPEKESKFQLPKLSELQLDQAVLAILIGVVLCGILWTWWNKTPNAALSAAQPAAIVEAVQIQFELLPTATMGSEVGMIIVPTSTVEAVATATAEATAEATAVPTAVPPTAIPPTAVPPTAVPVLVFWNSADKGVEGVDVFPVGGDGAVCSGDKVAGVQGPVTISFPPNYGNVEVVWGRCVVNGGTAQQIADEDTAAWGRQFVVKGAP